jgi:tetratricopeptide (TPR) repeat protein
VAEGAREIDLDAVRADGWFDRVIAGVPALDRLCGALGDALVALSLVAGFRIQNATIERTTGEVTSLGWTRDEDESPERVSNGPPNAMRTEVLAVLIGEPDLATKEPANDGDHDAIRAFIGPRYLLLAPLFGLTLRRLLLDSQAEPRIAAAHDGIEEIVTLKQLRRFLRSRVVEALQGGRGRGVQIDLEQARVAREAFDGGRYEEVVGRLAAWVAPLMMYHRTPEGAALDASTRADISRALGVLGQTFHKLGRAEESEEALRLAVQYAHDGPAAPEMYRTLGRTMMAEGRFSEAIAPLRRAAALDPVSPDGLCDLARCFVQTKKAVAAWGVLRMAIARSAPSDEVGEVEAEIRAALGDALGPLEAMMPAPEPLKADTERPPPPAA